MSVEVAICRNMEKKMKIREAECQGKEVQLGQMVVWQPLIIPVMFDAFCLNVRCREHTCQYVDLQDIK